VIFAIAPASREFHISTTSDADGAPAPTDLPSPFDWCGPYVPRTSFHRGAQCIESIYSGAMGSTSYLKITGLSLGVSESTLGQVIAEHCHFHAMVYETIPSGMGEFQLNQSEQAALYWSANGLTAKETAAEMKISFRSVEYFIKTAKDKLAAQNVTEAVYRAICTRQMKYSENWALGEMQTEVERKVRRA